MRNHVVVLLAIAVQMPAAGILVAQQARASDLAGTWIINKSKSDFGSLSAPTVDSIVVTRASGMYQFHVTSDFTAPSTRQYDYKWPIGGGEVTNNVNGATVHSNVKVNGDTLQQTSEVTMDGHTVSTQTGRNFVSADGKTMTREVDVHPSGGMSSGPLHLVLVYDRR